MNVLGGSESTLGNMKRTVPRIQAVMVKVNVVQAKPIQVNRKKRRSSPFLAAAGGLGAEAAGVTGVGGAAEGCFVGSLMSRPFCLPIWRKLGCSVRIPNLLVMLLVDRSNG